MQVGTRCSTFCSCILLALPLSFLPSRAEARLKVGLSLPSQNQERWVRDRDRMVEEAKRLDVDLRVQYTDNDAARQIAQCENLISQGIQILILAPHDATSASVIVDKAHKAGIKVISYDRLVLNSDVDVYLSFDNVRVGELQGRYLSQLVPKGNYVILSGAPTDNNAKLFRQGAMNILQPLIQRGEIKVLMDQPIKDWQPAEAQKLMEQALTANRNKVDAVLAPNDGTSGGCIQALSAQGLSGKVPITGQDGEVAAVIRILQGKQNMTVFKDTRLLGTKAIEMAIQMAKGVPLSTLVNAKVNNNKRDVPSVLLTPVVVDKTNADQVMVQSGYLKKEEVHKKKAG